MLYCFYEICPGNEKNHDLVIFFLVTFFDAKVTLSVPGSGPLQGEEMETILRIDENDFGSQWPCHGEFIPLSSNIDYMP
jgi:hypothetical protein